VDEEILLLAIQMANHLDLKVYILVQDQTMDVYMLESISVVGMLK